MVKMIYCFLGLTLGLFFLGCSGKTAEYSAKGAAAGAVSASLVGAITDLIIDGRVNTHRLERNIVGGAVAGGVVGGVAGHSMDKAEKQQKESAAAAPFSHEDNYSKLEKEIGPRNIEGLERLINCGHKEAFAVGMETQKSDNPAYSEAGLILQILVDHDRNNQEGVVSGITHLVQVNDKIGDKETAIKELEALSSALKDERKIQGLTPDCK